jgi:hypothetical protein
MLSADLPIGQPSLTPEVVSGSTPFLPNSRTVSEENPLQPGENETRKQKML